MTQEASQFIAEALKRVPLDGDFAPADIGKRIGFSRMHSEILARSLADAGVLELGFDMVAQFSPEYRKMNEVTVAEEKRTKKPKTRRAALAAAK